MKKNIHGVIALIMISIVLLMVLVPQVALTDGGEEGINCEDICTVCDCCDDGYDCDDGEWDKSSLEGDCITIDDGVLTARVCNTGDKAMQGTTPWELYWVASGNPKNASTPIATGEVPALAGGVCTDITYDTLDLNPEGNYGFRVFQRPCHPGKGELWITEICEPTPPVPEISTIVLMSLGLIALGGFVWFRRHKANPMNNW